MKIAAALAWFDEPVEFLDRCVRSLAGNVDHLIAVDGRWRLHTDGTHASSPRSQVRAVGAASTEVELPGAVITVGHPWASQCAKRDEMMLLAGLRGDWVLVVDGDCYLEAFDAEAVRTALEQTTCNVAELTVRNLNRPFPYRHLAPQTLTSRLLYRAGTRVTGPAHNDYTLDGTRLNGNPLHGPLAPALDLTGLVTVAHDNRNRGAARNAAAAAYRRARRAHGIEVRA